MTVGFDIDGVIDRLESFVSLVSRALMGSGHRVYIITSRSNDPDVINKTLAALKVSGVEFSDYYFLPSAEDRPDDAFPEHLDWYEKQIWQKAEFCRDRKVDIFFDDEQKVLDLVKVYSPRTVCVKVM